MSDSATEHRGLAALARATIEAVQTASVEPLSLIPARARYVVRLSPSVLFTIPKFDAAFTHILAKAEPKAIAVLSDWQTCGLTPASLESITVAGDDDGLWAAVVRGKGVGQPDNWRCARTMMVAASMDPDFEIGQDGEDTVMTSGDDGGRFVDEDTLVLFDARWENEVTALTDGKAEGDVRSTALGKLLARVPQDTPAWSAATLSPKLQSQIAGTGYLGVEAAWGSISTAEEFTLEMSLLAGPTGSAESYRGTARDHWKQFESFETMLGLTSGVLSKAEFEAEDDVATLRLHVTQDEVERVAAKVKEFM